MTIAKWVWNSKWVGGTGMVSNVYYVVWRAEYVCATGGMSAQSGMET